MYHVMMRGINHQNIFEEQEDYYQFLNTLDMMAQSYEPDGTPSGRNYVLYAYCLMSNRKVMNAGKMKAERVEPFMKLLEMSEQYRRKNQYE